MCVNLFFLWKVDQLGPENQVTKRVISSRANLRCRVLYWLGVMQHLPHEDISFLFGGASVTDLLCTVFSLSKLSERCSDAGTF